MLKRLLKNLDMPIERFAEWCYEHRLDSLGSWLFDLNDRLYEYWK